MNELLERVLHQQPLTPDDAQWVQSADPSELDSLVESLCQLMPDTVGLEPVLLLLTGRLREGEAAWGGEAAWDGVAAMERLYDSLSPVNPARGPVLQFLLEDGRDAALESVAAKLCNDPPQRTESVAQGLSPLFRERESVRNSLFLIERSWPALEHVNAASPLLDLMNFLCRKHAIEHPAAKRSASLRQLLAAVVARLEQIGKAPPSSDSETQAQQRAMVDEGVPLCVSLCDAMALIGDGTAQAALQQALSLPHRRIHTEAAWALAKLGEEPGEQVLVSQAADPYTRLRVIEYLQELELLDHVDPQYLTDASRAEAALCAWLAESTQFGIPPNELTLMDQRTLFWPGYEDEQACYLFHYVYQLPQGRLENVGLAGPVEHAFAANLLDMPVEDVYAMFAGWHAEHDEMEDVIPEQLTPAGQLELERLARRMRDCGYDAIQPVLFCQFFGDKALVAIAKSADHDGETGWAVADATDDFWLPNQARFGPVEASYVYKGRRLLHAFNEEESHEV